MDSKTLSTILIVIVCLLLFPVIIGIVGGVFGVVGGVIGGIFGAIAGIIGAVFGAIGGVIGAVFGIIASIFGAIFGFFGWLLGDWDHPWHGPFHWFDKDILGALALVIIVLLIARSRTPRRPAR